MKPGELTAAAKKLGISRQAMWARKQRLKGLCSLCSKKAVLAGRCRVHAERHRIDDRERKRKQKVPAVEERGTKVNGKVLVVASCLAVLFAPTATAQSRDQNLKWCNGNNPDLSVRGCAGLIESGHETTEILVLAFHNRGLAYENEGRYDLAIKDFDQEIKLNPKDASAFYGRSVGYLHKSRTDLAMADLDKAIALNPHYVKALSNRGVLYLNARQYQRALRDFDQAIEADPRNAVSFMDRGLAYDGLGQVDHAIQDYNQAIKLDPADPKAFYNRGNWFRAKGQLDSAIQDYDRAVQLNPDYTIALNNRGLTYVAQKQFDRSIQDFNEAIQRNVANPQGRACPLYNRGLAYSAKGQYDRAIQDYNQAIRLRPDFAMAFYFRGVAKHKQGDILGGNSDIARAKQLDPAVASLGVSGKWESQ